MTRLEAEKQTAKIAIEENIYLLIACHLEEKSVTLKPLADNYREYAQSLCNEQRKIWENVDIR